MSQQAITLVTQKEQEIAQKKVAAQAQAKAMVAKAQQEGQQLLQTVETRCAAAGKEQLTHMEAQAQTKAQQAQAQAQGQMEAALDKAQGQMAQAVDFVVKKVVTP